jgi:hypothetical protein
MKQTRIVPSSSLVTTVVVSGKPQHYFHSEVLGKCRAILIADDENLPRPAETKEQLLADLQNRLDYLPTIPLNADLDYQRAIDEIRVLRGKIYAIEQADYDNI